MSKILHAAKRVAGAYRKGRAIVQKAAQTDTGRKASKILDAAAGAAASASGHGEAYRAVRSAVSSEFGGASKYRRAARKDLEDQVKSKIISKILGN